ncbi:MAG: lytic polysaccharide monooxygenase auxiliary activity family 9 protein [Acidobacteriota bacterium]
MKEPRPSGIRRSRLATLLLVIIGGMPLSEVVLAHGTITTPASRIYKCRFDDVPEDPQDPACAAAVALAGSPQFLYDWNGVRQGDANGQHQEVVPDGQLCSGGGSEFAGLDLPRDDWRATSISPRADGTFEFIYFATAPHSTRDMLFYITRQGWDPTQPLRWEDLDLIDEPGNPEDPVDPFCYLTSVTLEPIPGLGDGYRMVCPLPERSGRHVIYQVWQRDDSPEAFYACVDVLMRGAGPIFGSDFETGDTSQWSSTEP